MKKLTIVLLFCFWAVHNALAVNMVQRESYFTKPIYIAGLPDYPPFSYYENRELKGAFLLPTIEAMKNQGIVIKPYTIEGDDYDDVRVILTNVRSDTVQVFMGAYANTQIFSGLNMLYPAAVTNPVHIFMLADNDIGNVTKEDLKNMNGVAAKSEYFNDFFAKKIADLNVQFVDDSLEGYRQVITGKADYMLGGLYYNRIMISRYGLGDYLVYSPKPLFKMPIFVAISKAMPKLSLYEEAFRNEFVKPEYVHKVKEEIVRIMNEEVDKNSGVVPPSFVPSDEEEEITEEPDIEEEFEMKPEFDENVTGAKIIEKKQEEIHKKTVDEILNEI